MVFLFSRDLLKSVARLPYWSTFNLTEMRKNRYAFPFIASWPRVSVVNCNSVRKLDNAAFSLANSMKTNPIQPCHLPRMACYHVQSCPAPQKWRRKVVPKPWMIPPLRVSGRGVPPWRPKPGSSRSTSSYSSRSWRSELRNGPTREDLGPASNSLIQFSGKAEVSAHFAPCILVYSRNVTM